MCEPAGLRFLSKEKWTLDGTFLRIVLKATVGSDIMIL